MHEPAQPTVERTWKAALDRLLLLDQHPDDTPLLQQTQQWLLASNDNRLAQLAKLLKPGMTREQLWHVLVPVERGVSRAKATDVTILDADLPGTAAAPPLPVTIILDNLRSALNLGGIFRTAECFALQDIILTGYTADPANDPRVAAASLGTEQRIPWRRLPRVQDAIAECHNNRIPCIALETVADAPTPDHFAWPQPCAIILGNERFGLLPQVIQACDAVVRIPMYGAKNSLNVVSAFAIVAYQIRR